MQGNSAPRPSLYVHVPFCVRKCAYCDFYSVVYDEATASAYVDVLARQIDVIECGISTVFIGGGTPTALSAPLLKKLLRGMKKHLHKEAEFTVEANPESLSAEKLGILSDGGVNRLSIGIQSFRDRKLKDLGRSHNADKAVKAVMLAEKKGFRNLNIDLIFGAPGETFEDCAAEFKRAADLPVAHISCYCLTYEKGTPLFEAEKKGEIIPADEEYSARIYSYAMDYLPRRGFRHYEVSNFACEGKRCAHNMNYWENGEYIGLGPSAVSYIRGVRKRYVPDVKEYIKKISSGGSGVISSERLAGDRRAKETAAIKIRTSEGIDFGWFRKKTGCDFMELEADAVTKLSGLGLIKCRKRKGAASGIALTKRGFLFCDTVSSELL